MGRQAQMYDGVQLGIRLPREQVDLIDAQLELRPELMNNRSAVVREAVQFYLDSISDTRRRFDQKQILERSKE